LQVFIAYTYIYIHRLLTVCYWPTSDTGDASFFCQNFSAGILYDDPAIEHPGYSKWPGSVPPLDLT
jgi:hypothetical protein